MFYQSLLMLFCGAVLAMFAFLLPKALIWPAVVFGGIGALLGALGALYATLRWLFTPPER